MAVQDSRLARLREACAERGAAAFYVRDTSDIRWLTGFDGVFDTEAAHLLLVTAEGAWLHTDSRYVTAAEAAAVGTPIAVDASVKTHAAFAAEKLAEADGVSDGVALAVAIDDGMSLAEFRRLEEAFAKAGAESAPRHLQTERCSEKGECSSEDCLRTAGSGPSSAGIRAFQSTGREVGDEAPLSAAASEGSMSMGDAAPAQPDGTGREVGDEAPLSAAAAGAGGPFATISETSGLIVNLRAVKDRDEVARLAAAQAITDAAFAHICGFIRPGMTERTVQLELDDFMMRSGAEALAFSTIVAAGAHGASPHAIPGNTVLEAGQCVVMDYGAKLGGYCSDMTRMVFLGEPDQRMREAYAVLRRANEEVEAALQPGMTGIEAHELAERILEEGGFGGKMGHGLGHGVGLDIHEQPNLNRRNDKPLVPGNVVTVEPGIYLPGEFGMRLEDFGIITRKGFAAFTQSTHEMVVL